jgi:hypothetical protein
MLKQTFDNNAIIRVLTSKDVSRWAIFDNILEKNDSIDSLVESIKAKNFEISPLKCEIKRDKPTYQTTNVEDAISIKLLDRYLRRIYKVRQSDRNRIVSQVKTLLQDSGDYAVLRLDIEKCYESMDFEKIIDKLNNDMILAPSCMRLLHSILKYCKATGIKGLPRGLAISPTLAELYLEPIDKFIKQFEGVVYYTRYVDDLFILVDRNIEYRLFEQLKTELSNITLTLNDNSEEKKYIGPSQNANFNYLGYSFKVTPTRKKPNKVEVTISPAKLSKIKQKIAKSLHDYSKTSDIRLLQQRLNYLAVIKEIKKSKNGVLLGGIAYNYRYVSDQFNCLKALDGFLFQMIKSPRYGFTVTNISALSKVSFFGSATHQKQGKFTRKKAALINKVWKNV